MIAICFGFFFTALSTFGVRIYLMRSSTTAAFTRSLWDSTKSFRSPLKFIRAKAAKTREMLAAQDKNGFERGFGVLGLWTVEIAFGSASSIKHPGLSWSGVAWRSAAASLVAILNIMFWFSELPYLISQNPSRYVPTVFFFGD